MLRKVICGSRLKKKKILKLVRDFAPALTEVFEKQKFSNCRESP